MISIILDNDRNKKLDTNENVNIPLEFNNPMFGNVNDLFKSYSYSFVVPKTPKNGELLDYANYINTKKKWTAKNASIYKNGVLIASGDLIIRSATESSISLSLQINKKVDWFNGRKMTELKEMGYQWQMLTDDWYVELWLRDFPQQSEANYDFGGYVEIEISGIVYLSNFVTFPFTTDINYQATLQNLRDVINADTANNNALAIYNVTYLENLRIERVDTTKPFYVLPTAKYVEQSESVFLYGVIDNVGLDNLTKDFIDYVVANPNDFIFHYASQFILHRAEENNYVEMNHFVAGEYNFSDDKLSIVSPQIYCREGLQKLLGTFGFKLEDGGFFDETLITKMFFCNNQSNAPILELPGPPVDDNFFAFPEYFFWYKDKFPDSTLADWLQDLAKLFCLYVDINHTTKTVRVKSLNDIIKAKVAAEYETADTYQIEVATEDTGYKFEQPTPEFKDTYKETFEAYNEVNYQDLTVGNGGTNVKTNITFPESFYEPNGTLIAFQIPSYFTGWWNNTPKYSFAKAVKQTGINTEFFGVRGNSPKANGLAFETGFFDGKPRCYWSFGQEVLHWGIDNLLSDFGLYNRRWRIFTNFIDNAQLVKRKIYLSSVELATLDLSKKVRIDNQNYFIKKLRTSLTHQQTNKIVCEVELFTV